MKDCCKDLQNLQKEFIALLIANGETLLKQSKNNKNVDLETELRNEGFAPKVIKQVAAKLRKSQKRSSNHYSKKTGLLKK